MDAKISVRAAAATIGPRVGSVTSVTLHKTRVRSTQTKQRSLDTEFIPWVSFNKCRNVRLRVFFRYETPL